MCFLNNVFKYYFYIDFYVNARRQIKVYMFNEALSCVLTFPGDFISHEKICQKGCCGGSVQVTCCTYQALIIIRYFILNNEI